MSHHDYLLRSINTLASISKVDIAQDEALKPKAPKLTLTDIAKAMFKAYHKQAVALKPCNPLIWMIDHQPEWESVEDVVQLCWIAAAGEAVAQVAAMSAMSFDRSDLTDKPSATS